MIKIETSLIGIACILYGYFIGYTFPPEPKTITKVVSTPPTDDQLLEFWFGAGDKASLRKRICK